MGVQCPFRQCLEHSDVSICADWAVLLHSSGTKGLNKNIQTKYTVKSWGQGENLWFFIKDLILFYGIIDGRNLCSKWIAFLLKTPMNAEMICYITEKYSASCSSFI